MSTPTTEQIAKLPAWARNYVRDLENDRASAVDAFKRWRDQQTPSDVSYPEFIRIEDGPAAESYHTRYIQTDKVQFTHGGVKLSVTARKGEIRLQWTSADGSMDDVAFIPESFQAAVLVAKENMR